MRRGKALFVFHQSSSALRRVEQVQEVCRATQTMDSLALIKIQGTDRSYRTMVAGEEVNCLLPLFRCGSSRFVSVPFCSLWCALGTRVILSPPLPPLSTLTHNTVRSLVRNRLDQRGVKGSLCPGLGPPVDPYLRVRFQWMEHPILCKWLFFCWVFACLQFHLPMECH